MTTLDKVLVSIDRSPFDGVLRAVIGFVTVPVLSVLRRDVHSVRTLIIGLLSLLLSLRIAPVFLRKVLPLSSEVKAVWAERRQVAKRYDSFQWQKLFFVGIGLTCYMLVSKDLPTLSLAISGFCVLSGAIAMVIWYMQAPSVRSTVVNKYVL